MSHPMETPEPSPAERLLRTLWLDMRNDAADARGMAFARGAIAGAHEVGALTDEQRELWERRIATCPGHDDEGGRSWCAYCGDMAQRRRVTRHQQPQAERGPHDLHAVAVDEDEHAPVSAHGDRRCAARPRGE